MRRTRLENNLNIINRIVKKVYPIFSWYQCEKCGEYVKLEWLYKETIDRTYYKRERYGCVKCFKSKEEFYMFDRAVPAKSNDEASYLESVVI